MLLLLRSCWCRAMFANTSLENCPFVSAILEIAPKWQLQVFVLLKLVIAHFQKTLLGAFSVPMFVVFPTPPEGRGTIYSNGFFCSDNFDRSIYSSYKAVSGINIKPLQSRIQNLKDFLEFRILQGIIEV